MSGLSLDAEALGRGNGWQRSVEFFADWFAGRAFCRCPIADQKHGPCASPAETAQRDSSAWYRTHRTDRAVQRVHDYCDQPELWKVASELRRQRPGAREPWEDCSGCCFSYFGEIEEDRSLVAAFTRHAPGAAAGLERMPHQELPLGYRRQKRPVPRPPGSSPPPTPRLSRREKAERKKARRRKAAHGNC